MPTIANETLTCLKLHFITPRTGLGRRFDHCSLGPPGNLRVKLRVYRLMQLEITISCGLSVVSLLFFFALPLQPSSDVAAELVAV